jgi:hypothetical protein
MLLTVSDVIESGLALQSKVKSHLQSLCEENGLVLQDHDNDQFASNDYTIINKHGYPVKIEVECLRGDYWTDSVSQLKGRWSAINIPTRRVWADGTKNNIWLRCSSTGNSFIAADTKYWTEIFPDLRYMRRFTNRNHKAKHDPENNLCYQIPIQYLTLDHPKLVSDDTDGLVNLINSFRGKDLV